MRIRYGLTPENEELIVQKAKSKRDGVFTFRGVCYRVRGGFVTHFAVNSKILERAFGFNCVVGSYKYEWTDSAKKALQRI